MHDICTPQTDRGECFLFYMLIYIFYNGNPLHNGNTVKLGAVIISVLVAKCPQSNLFSLRCSVLLLDLGAQQSTCKLTCQFTESHRFGNLEWEHSTEDDLWSRSPISFSSTAVQLTNLGLCKCSSEWLKVTSTSRPSNECIWGWSHNLFAI